LPPKQHPASEQFLQSYGPWAVVAGASEGLGAAYSEALARRGLHLLLVARRSELLQALAARLSAAYSVQVRSLSLDLALQDSAARITHATQDLPVGLLVYNAVRVNPSTVSSGACEYPEGIEERIAAAWPNVRAVDASALAAKAGTVKAANVVMLGAMASALPFTPEMLESVIKRSVPPKTIDVNLAAFHIGLEVAAVPA